MKTLRVLLLAGVAALSTATPSRARVATIDRCASSLVNDVLHFVAKKSKCIRACEDAVRKNRLPSSVRCQPPSNNEPTQKCLDKANERIGSRQTSRLCQDDEVALRYGNTTTCRGQNQTREEILACFQDQAESFVDRMLEQIYFPVGSPVPAFLEQPPRSLLE